MCASANLKAMRVVFDTNLVMSAFFWRGSQFKCPADCDRKPVVAIINPPLLAEYDELLPD
jgi:predicted nucleic acid-binding protein